ncbi:MAG: crossover junction endodeoxyribonuclease RuvC [Clostridia bacterium]|nr:crossover junction endodeoxyribonuclease RuvC [Clostridia bacterium]
MRVIGIDPGLALMGFGVVESDGYRFKVLDYGVLETPAHTKDGDRLLCLFKGLNELFEKYQPDAVSVEELFFNKNVKTAIAVGQARGVALLAVTNFGIPLFEYTPLQAKQAVVGYGRAEKQQIQHMVKTILNLKEIPKPDDAADALAIAITHINNAGMIRKTR